MDELFFKEITRTMQVEEQETIEEEIKVLKKRIEKHKQKNSTNNVWDNDGGTEKIEASVPTCSKVYVLLGNTDEELFYQKQYEGHGRPHTLLLQRHLSEAAIESKRAPYLFFYKELEQLEALPSHHVETMRYDEVEDLQRRAKYEIDFEASKTGAEKLQYYYWSLFAHNQVLEYLLYLKA